MNPPPNGVPIAIGELTETFKDITTSTSDRDILSKIEEEVREAREDHRDDVIYSRVWAVSVSANTLPTHPADFLGTRERLLLTSPSPKDVLRDHPDSAITTPPLPVASVPSNPPVEMAVPSAPAEGSSSRTAQPTPETIPPLNTLSYSVADVAVEMMQGIPLAGILPIDLCELEDTARNFLDRLEALAPEWCGDGCWGYVWLTAGALLAGGVTHGVLVARSRARSRLVGMVEMELEDTHESHRDRRVAGAISPG